MTPNLDCQTEYWNRVAWDKKFTIPPDFDALTSRLDSDARILDYGCGYGRVASSLKTLGYKNVVGVDASPEIIRRGLAEHPDLDLRLLDGPRTSFADGWFDAVVLAAVLTCVPGGPGQRSILSELNRVLKPGGTLYIADFLINDDRRNIDRYEKYADKYGVYGVFELDEGAVLRHHDIGWITELTEKFEQLKLDMVTVSTMNGSQSKAFHYIGIKPG